MNGKYIKVKYFFLALTIIVLGSVTLGASQIEEHVHGENCVYSCELDTIHVSADGAALSGHGHIDHPESESCVYGCEHSFNTYCSPYNSERVWTDEEAESFLREYDACSSDEDMVNLISKYYGIPAASIDLDELRSFAKYTETDIITRDFLNDYMAASSDEEMAAILSEFSGRSISVSLLQELLADAERDESEVTFSSDEELKNLIAERYGISPSEVDLDALRADAELNGDWEQLLCQHSYLLGSCQGDHISTGTACEFSCKRQAACMYRCGSKFEIVLIETVHTWSEGWCGRTCRICGLIELFHEPGGCWFCS